MTMKRGKNNMEAKNVVVIDLDNDSFSNVNMNMPKKAAKKPHGSKGLETDKNFPMKAYIYIDDDENECPWNYNTGKMVPPVKVSNSKRTYPGRGPATCYVSSIQLDGDDVAEDVDDDSKAVVDEKEGKNTDATDDASGEGKIVMGREMIMDTAEFKKAQEEELAARQLALKLQAEEAQKQRRLLKRKKAEKLRLLDIKRRQKQRIEEIRESQKQDEEIMNKKEIYRLEVQQDLKKLEKTCHDMASLLCGLGIFRNNPYATSDQVHAAYKRALLRFHPDRACPGSDMRQQVEAEEKFKLISRMKEKVNKIPSLKY